MKKTDIRKRIIVAALAGFLCIGLAKAHTILSSEMGYMDPYGKEWKYKKTLSEMSPDEVTLVTYVIYTNEKNFTCEDVRRAWLTIEMGPPDDNSNPGQFMQYYLVSVDHEIIPTPTPAAFYINNQGTSFLQGEYNLFSNMLQAGLFPESYLEKMTREEVDEILEMDIFGEYFDYSSDLEVYVSKDKVWTEGLVYQDKGDVIDIKTPSQGQLKVVLEKWKEEILKRAQQEKKEDFDYYGMKVVHAEFTEVIASVDFKEKMWRVQFSDKENYKHNCYVYIGFDGLTKRVVQAEQHYG